MQVQVISHVRTDDQAKDIEEIIHYVAFSSQLQILYCIIYFIIAKIPPITVKYVQSLNLDILNSKFL